VSDEFVSREKAVSEARRSGMITDRMPALRVTPPLVTGLEVSLDHKEHPAAPEEPEPDAILQPAEYAERQRSKEEAAAQAKERAELATRPEGWFILKTSADYAFNYGKTRDNPGVTVPAGKLPGWHLALSLVERRRSGTENHPFYRFSETQIAILEKDAGFQAHVKLGKYSWVKEIPTTAMLREEQIENELLRLRRENAKLKSEMDAATAPGA
jgi:hypothetical protein